MRVDATRKGTTFTSESVEAVFFFGLLEKSAILENEGYSQCIR